MSADHFHRRPAKFWRSKPLAGGAPSGPRGCGTAVTDGSSSWHPQSKARGFLPTTNVAWEGLTTRRSRARRFGRRFVSLALRVPREGSTAARCRRRTVAHFAAHLEFSHAACNATADGPLSTYSASRPRAAIEVLTKAYLPTKLAFGSICT